MWRVCQICNHRYQDRATGRGPQTCPFDGGELIALPDPFLGRVIGGRYVLDGKLGQGGFGVVYRASHETVGRDVAIKFLLPDLASNPLNRERFLREARAANRIDHEHIIDITDFGETEDGLVYLVMELLEGRSLADEVGNGPMPVPRALDIAMQCTSALARAHELGVVHRDIKPENIHLITSGTRRDYVKLLDFGLAQMKGELRLTATGAVFGTPEYMAPEQARGAPLTALADLYALGCVLFEMLTGRAPFSGTTADLILKHMREAAPRVSHFVPSVSPALDELVAKLLQKDPAKRHRDAYHLLAELKRIDDAMPHIRVDVAPAVDDLAKTRERRRSVYDASKTAQVPSTWERRIALFRELATKVHGEAIPVWLRQTLDAFGAAISRLQDVEKELTRNDEAATTCESELRSTRLRLGRAVDELGRDESRANGDVDEYYRELSALRQNHVTLEANVARMILQLRAPTAGATVSLTMAQLMVDSGKAAAAWMEAEKRLVTIHEDVRRRERERDDLRFQVSQLKGRLASMSVEQDMQVAKLRENSARLGRERQVLLDETAHRGAQVTQHLQSFPQLRDLWLGETPLNLGPTR